MFIFLCSGSITDTATAPPTFTATFTPTASQTPSPTPRPSGPVTINYTYDPLGRLVAADYSSGDYYHYAYDSVGDRLTQQNMVNGLPSTVSYAYDAANRLTSVNNINYTWDNNGNLLNDGANSYVYDSANRLSSVTNQTSTISYQYNGLGDRLQQTVNGAATNYILDLNAGLTQVLYDGT